ncbi:MAG: DinB family protein [Gemmatimonadota bacterium]|nr:DinB family protein [Gemmatimonadota bacterium]
MSIFTNPASGAAGAANAYVSAILELVGDRDPLEILGSTVEWCRVVVEGLNDRQLRTPESRGKWSVVEVMQHLADSELVWGYRLRKVLAEDRPRLTGFDQDLWARRLGYAVADATSALEMFSALRRANLALLSKAAPEDLDRAGVHEERGEESVRHMMRLYAGHDLAHRRQLDRIVAGL